jgi:hypothetical protein
MPLTAAEKTLASMNALYGPAGQALQGGIHRGNPPAAPAGEENRFVRQSTSWPFRALTNRRPWVLGAAGRVGIADGIE